MSKANTANANTANVNTANANTANVNTANANANANTANANANTANANANTANVNTANANANTANANTANAGTANAGTANAGTANAGTAGEAERLARVATAAAAMKGCRTRSEVLDAMKDAGWPIDNVITAADTGTLAATLETIAKHAPQQLYWAGVKARYAGDHKVWDRIRNSGVLEGDTVGEWNAKLAIAAPEAVPDTFGDRVETIATAERYRGSVQAILLNMAKLGEVTKKEGAGPLFGLTGIQAIVVLAAGIMATDDLAALVKGTILDTRARSDVARGARMIVPRYGTKSKAKLRIVDAE